MGQWVIRTLGLKQGREVRAENEGWKLSPEMSSWKNICALSPRDYKENGRTEGEESESEACCAQPRSAAWCQACLMFTTPLCWMASVFSNLGWGIWGREVVQLVPGHTACWWPGWNLGPAVRLERCCLPWLCWGRRLKARGMSNPEKVWAWCGQVAGLAASHSLWGSRSSSVVERGQPESLLKRDLSIFVCSVVISEMELCSLKTTLCLVFRIFFRLKQY